MRRFRLIITCGILGLAFFLSQCGEKRPLPTGPVDTGQNVAAGDTMYTRVNPDWPADEYSLNDPQDIFVNRDGYIFVADKGNSRVLVMNKSGNVIDSSDNFGNKNFDDITDISSYTNSGAVIQPTGISADTRMNIFIVDSTNTVYVWNQYINNIGVESVASEFVMGSDTISADQYWRSYSPGDEIQEIVWSEEPARIDSILKPRMFFTTTMPRMISSNYGSSPESSRFNAVAAWQPSNIANPEREGSLYLADASFYNRIIRVDYRRYRLVRLSTGQTIWLHRGKFHSFAVNKGSGQGTVMFPTGLYFNYFEQDPKLYYSQTDDNFGAHRVSLSSSEFDLPENSDIGEIGRFKNAQDITSDENGHIYVANTFENYVEEFSPNGNFLRYIGTQEIRDTTTVVDTVINAPGDTTFTESDSIFIRYEPNVFTSPEAVAVSEGEVYIVDNAGGTGRIIRYKLSTDVDINYGERP